MPLRCYGCHTLVEHVGHGPQVDRRIPANEILLCPPLCWECRGAVLLHPPPPDDLFYPMEGDLGALGVRTARTGGTPGGVPVLRLITGPLDD